MKKLLLGLGTIAAVAAPVTAVVACGNDKDKNPDNINHDQSEKFWKMDSVTFTYIDYSHHSHNITLLKNEMDNGAVNSFIDAGMSGSKLVDYVALHIKTLIDSKYDSDCFEIISWRATGSTKIHTIHQVI